MSQFSSWWFWCAIAAAVVSAAPQATPTLLGPGEPQPTTCGDLRRQLLDQGSIVYAKEVYDCAVTVPFNAAVGTRLVKYYEDALQYQANLDYMKAPPPGYQQPAVDLLAGLRAIQDQINAGGFANEYQFESSLTNLLYSANDPHLNVDFGIINAFSYGTYNGLVSLSKDGVAAPKIYLVADVFDSQLDRDWQPSAVSTIDGTDVTEYLTRFAALNSPGSVEPHADFNMLFENPTRDAFIDSYSLFGGGATFYPGDTLEFTFENGTTLSDRWVAVYSDYGDSGPLETGGDVYNYFVLGLLPASVDYQTVNQQSSSPVTDEEDDSSFYSDYFGDANPLYYFSGGAFPEYADVEQASTTDTRYISGYLLNGTDVAALSLPTFAASNESVTDFSNAVASFITKSKSAGFTKIVIDVQQNGGGDELLAYNTFRQFFPDQEPFGGSTMRVSEYVNVTGSVLNELYQQEVAAGRAPSLGVSSEWLITKRLDADGNHPFTSFAEFFGPYEGSILHTATERLNLADRDFIQANLDTTAIPAPLVNPATDLPTFAAQDITILSDAACSSACSLFVEAMKQAGVKTVVVGGRPDAGPMQTVGGSRGARYYDLEADLDPSIRLAQLAGGASAAVLPNRNDQSVFFFASGLTLRNQVRQGSDVPLQMIYDAADCRLYNSFDNFYNLTTLWLQAVNASANPSLCVPGSTGFASTPGTGTSSASPPRTTPAGLTYNPLGALQISFPDGSEHPIKSNGPVPDDDVPASIFHGFKVDEEQRVDRDKSATAIRPPRACDGKKRKRQSCTAFYYADSRTDAFRIGYQDGATEGKADQSRESGSAGVSRSYKAGYDAGYERGRLGDALETNSRRPTINARSGGLRAGPGRRGGRG